VEHAQSLPSSFPWRLATVVVGTIAAAELVALIAIGAVRIAPSHHKAVAHAATPAPVRVHVPPPPSHPLRSRAQTPVLVLNGNGRQGAASAQAMHLNILGYTVAGAENAPRHDYAQSMVMYVPGFLPEARRLAHDIDVRLVAPLDGLTPGKLKASKLVVLLGS
jgi:hypothetical protein